MDTVQITAVVGVIVAAFAGIVVPYVLYRRKQRADADLTSVVSWDKMAARLDSERDSLQKRLDESEDRHRKQIDDMEADWGRRETTLRRQIADLQAEVDALGRQLAQALRRGGGAV